MYIAKRPRRGHDYFLVNKTRREGKKVKNETVLYLGRLDNLSQEELCEVISKVDELDDEDISNKFRKLLFTLEYTVQDMFCVERSLHYGDVLMLYTIADMLDIPQIIRQNTTKGGGPDIGKVTAIMAVSQALAPTSKNDLRNWYEETALEYVSGIAPKDVEEWVLYSCMDQLTKERIENIEADIVEHLVDKFNISLDTCLYDLTSTFFYGRRDDFKKHGYNRDHMHHLVQVVIGMAVTKEHGFPIKHWVHPGNTTDVTALPKAAKAIKDLYSDNQVTLVFDRGNLSEKNVNILDDMGYEYICGLKRNVVVVKDIIRRARDEAVFEIVKTIKDDEGNDKPLKAGTVIAKLWGKKRKVVVCYSEPLADAELKSRTKAIEGAKGELEGLDKKTEEKNYSHDHLVIELYKILDGVGKYFSSVITDNSPEVELSISKTKKGKELDGRVLQWTDKRIERLKQKAGDMSPEDARVELKQILGENKRYYRYRVIEAKEYSKFTWELKEDVVGKNSELDGYYAVMSTDTEISLKDIIDINDSRDMVEKTFQTLKNPVKIRPVRHWVPRRVRTHVYICILGYLLRQMLRFLMKQKSLDLSIREALIELRRIKLIQVGERERTVGLKLTRLNGTQKELFDLVGLPYGPPKIESGP